MGYIVKKHSIERLKKYNKEAHQVFCPLFLGHCESFCINFQKAKFEKCGNIGIPKRPTCSYFTQEIKPKNIIMG